MTLGKAVGTQTLSGLIAARQRTASGPSQLPTNNNTNRKIEKSIDNNKTLQQPRYPTCFISEDGMIETQCSMSESSRQWKPAERMEARQLRLVLVSLPKDLRPTVFDKKK